MSDDLPLLSWRPAEEPSETPEKFKRTKGDPRDYRVEWDRFVKEHPAIAISIKDDALDLMRSGAKRIEINALFAEARARHRCTLNNSLRAAAASWIVDRNPDLDDLIERRRRKATR